MSISIFKEKFQDLENIWRKDENGIEFIYARDLQKVLGYTEWRKFEGVIEKAKTSCEENKNNIDDHFGDAANMVELGSGSQREVKDYKLTRYACYLTAQNGDPRKPEIAFSQNYFATQTRKFELVMQIKNDNERILERDDLKGKEKKFSDEMYQRGLDGFSISRVRSSGDGVLFGGNNTKTMKSKLGIPSHHRRPLADFLDPIAVTAKKFATQISNHNIVVKNMQGETEITKQHISSNATIREALIKENIYPEDLPAQEDIKKVKSRFNEGINSISNPKVKIKKNKKDNV